MLSSGDSYTDAAGWMGTSGGGGSSSGVGQRSRRRLLLLRYTVLRAVAVLPEPPKRRHPVQKENPGVWEYVRLDHKQGCFCPVTQRQGS